MGVVLAGEAIGPLALCGAAVILIASAAAQAIERRHRLGAVSKGPLDIAAPAASRMVRAAASGGAANH